MDNCMLSLYVKSEAFEKCGVYVELDKIHIIFTLMFCLNKHISIVEVKHIALLKTYFFYREVLPISMVHYH
jgi:hypothetical protein